MLVTSAGAASQSWEYTGEDIPEADNEHFYLNLWIYENDYPEEEVEIVLSDFYFTSEGIKEGYPDGEQTF